MAEDPGNWTLLGGSNSSPGESERTDARSKARKLVLDTDSLETIRGFFAAIGREMADNNAKQAYFPEGADILANPVGAVARATVLDATGPPYGTAYASSDLTVASFGLDPGRVFAGQDGAATVTAYNRKAGQVVKTSDYKASEIAVLNVDRTGITVDGR